MPFIVENKELSVIKFTVTGSLTLDELKKILGILTRVLGTKKPFAFYVDCNFTESPREIIELTKYLITWMKESHQDIINYLQCSSLIIKSNIVAGIFNTVFKMRGPVKPNYITTNYKLGEDFVLDKMRIYFKENPPARPGGSF